MSNKLLSFIASFIVALVCWFVGISEDAVMILGIMTLMYITVLINIQEVKKLMESEKQNGKNNN